MLFYWVLRGKAGTTKTMAVNTDERSIMPIGTLKILVGVSAVLVILSEHAMKKNIGRVYRSFILVNHQIITDGPSYNSQKNEVLRWHKTRP